MYTKKQKIIIISVFLCSILLNISLIFNDSVWYDEAYTMNLLRGTTFTEIIAGTAIDVHPPLYYLITKIFFLILGYSVPIGKLSSLTATVLCLILCLTILNKRLIRTTNQCFAASIFLILLFSFSPCSMRENIELRMYTWAMLFVTASAVFAFELYNKLSSKKYWFLFTLSSICAAYTHYFALIAVAIIYIVFFCLLLRTKKVYLKLYFISGIACILAYLPWLPIFFRQIQSVRGGYWIPDFTLYKLMEYIQWPFSGSFSSLWLILLAYLVLVLITFLANHMNVPAEERKQNIFLSLCAINPCITIGIGWILSKLIKPIFVERYLFVCMGLVYIFIAYTLSYISGNKQLKLLILSLTLCTSLFSYTDQRKKEYENGTEASKEIFRMNIASDDLVATNDYILGKQDGSPLRYYLYDNKLLYVESDEDVKIFESYNKIWFFCVGEFDSDYYSSFGYNSTWIYEGYIDTEHPYTLYLLQKSN